MVAMDGTNHYQNWPSGNIDNNSKVTPIMQTSLYTAV